MKRTSIGTLARVRGNGLNVATAVAVALTVWSAQAGRITSDFNGGWEFSRDKAKWRAVEVPHDWAVEGPFDPNGAGGSGKLPWRGVGWYRKSLVLDGVPKDRRVFLAFDGVMCDGTAYVNGQPCGRQPYGYLGFRADATSYLYKGTNTIMVKADTTKLNSRWYPGAGMYRRVRMVETDNIYLDERDVAVTTPNVSKERATVRVRGAVTSRILADAPATVTLADAKGTPVPRDSRRVSFSVEGPGRIVSVGNSNPKGHDSSKATASHPLHNGRAGLAIKRTAPGKIVLRASADGLAPAAIRFWALTKAECGDRPRE